jgi:hypothetical protein
MSAHCSDTRQRRSRKYRLIHDRLRGELFPAKRERKLLKSRKFRQTGALDEHQLGR